MKGLTGNGKVVVVTGSYPPDVCGVGDYVFHLINAGNAGNWQVFVKSDWSIANIKKYIKEINDMNPDKLIIQYPTQGYGWSFLPFILMIYFTKSMKEKCIVTYHEFSNQSFKARLCENLALLGIKRLVVTNEYEKKAVMKYHKKLRTDVIKICSNIPKAFSLKDISEREIHYCCFGQIRPNKGIEEYIELVKDISDEKRILIGTIPKGFEEYGNIIITKAKKVGIMVKNDASLEEAADLLNNCKMVVLPFPDGLSERRGSFLAAAVNGCLICSTSGKYTPRDLRECIFIELPSGANDIRSKLNGINTVEWELWNKKVNDYLIKNIPQSWEQVVEQYNSL